MSSALLRKSLELVESAYIHEVFGKPGSEQYSQIKSLTQPPKRKELRGIADVKKKNLKIVEKVKRKVKTSKDKINENIRKLKVLHKLSVDDKIIELILGDSKKPGTESNITVEEQKTVFTEEDFRQFEREYFCS